MSIDTVTHDFPPALCIMGPTASGKTGLAMQLREHLPVELISVDASQVYRDMDIGTAKPTAEELAQAPHRLIDIRDPAESYSAAEFCTDALREMHDITAAGRIPLLVGGTMFYFRALEFGLSALPEADPEVRQRLDEQAQQTGWPVMHARLAGLDPDMAARINQNDAQRIQRALEIYELTGQPPSQVLAQRLPEAPPYRFIKVALMPGDREVLRQHIAGRFDKMLQAGLVQEVQALLNRGDLSPNLPSIRMVGYRQVWEFLQGGIDEKTMITQAVTSTRRLAKRQYTWLRRYPGVMKFDPQQQGFERQVLELFRSKLGMINT